MTAVNLSSYPYHDDYDASKGFHKIAFVPARPIQARELTQLQSILQDQVKKMGNHFFKNGTVILPGHTYYDNSVKAIRVESKYNEASVDSYILSLIGLNISNASGTTAKIVHAETSSTTTTNGVTTSNPPIIYVKFISGGTLGKETFETNDTLTTVEYPALGLTGSKTYQVTQTASIVSISEGVYYANGYFIQVADQIIVVSNSTDKPTIQIGLNVEESIVTEADDETLFDNAIGSTNYTSPGAHRLKIALTLAKRDYSTDTTIDEANNTRVDFILLYSLNGGVIQFEKGDDTEYARFEKLLAKRTFEESGNYIIDPFEFSTYDFRNNERGNWAQNTAYLEGDLVTNGTNTYYSVTSGISGGTAPTHTTGTVSDGGISWTWIKNARQYKNFGKYINPVNYGFDITDALDKEKEADNSFIVDTKSGIAYINGFRTEIKGVASKVVDKARTSKEIFNSQLVAPNPFVVYATNLANNSAQTPITSIPNIQALDSFNIQDIDSVTIGTCNVKSIETVSTAYEDEIYKVAIFNIKMNSGKEFAYNAFKLVGTGTSSATTVILSRQLIKLNGSFSSSTTTVTGENGANFETEVRVGNYVSVGTRTKTLHKITAVTSSVQMSVTPAPSPALANQDLYVNIVSFTKGADTYVSELPKTNIKTLRSVDANGNTNTSYRCIKQITQNSTGAGGLVHTLPPGEKFMPSGHFLYKDNTTTAVVILDAWISGDGSTLTVPNAALDASQTYRIHAKITKSNVAAAERQKNFKSITVYVFADGVWSTPNKTGGTQLTWIPEYAKNNYKRKDWINLGKADVIRVNSIHAMAADAVVWADATATDMTSYFDLDSGQRPEFYDFGAIKLKNTSAVINGPLRISYDYFEHTSGDYFTVDSYVDIPYALIPTVTLNRKQLNLRDCVDFRIRVNDAGAGSKFSMVGDTMQTNEIFVFDFSYYLGRKDLLILKPQNQLEYIYGTPAEYPKLPSVSIIGDSMPILSLDIAPYTYDAETEVTYKVLGNKNYTMKEIEKLDKRLSNVEEYVQLSLLEQNTAKYDIKDKYGLDRLKNGFYVVEFNDNNVHIQMGSNTADYRCNVDPAYAACIPGRFTTEYPVLISNTNSDIADSVGSVADMAMYPNLLMTLRPTAMSKFNLKGVIDATQPKLTSKINVNPFNAFHYFGRSNVYPSVDTWRNSVLRSETLFTTSGSLGVSSAQARTGTFEQAAASFRSAWNNGAGINTWALNQDTLGQDLGGNTVNVNTANQSFFNWSFQGQWNNSSVQGRGTNLANSVWAGAWWGVQSTTVNLNTNSLSPANVELASVQPRAFSHAETDTTIRPRTLVHVARNLMPNMHHDVNFDNMSWAFGGSFRVHRPLKITITGSTLSGASVAAGTTIDSLVTNRMFKFYDEFSVYGSNANVESSASTLDNKWTINTVTSWSSHRTFANWTGMSYDNAFYGQLVKLTSGGDCYGILVGWEHTATNTVDLFIFPTSSNKDTFYALAENTAITVEFQNENASGTTTVLSPFMKFTGAQKQLASDWTSPLTSTTSGRYIPKSTSQGNLYFLIQLLPDVFRTGERKVTLSKLITSSNVAASKTTAIKVAAEETVSSDSSAECTYTGTGITEVHVEKFVYRLLANFSMNNLAQLWQWRWGDPLAQTFRIKKNDSVNTDFIMVDNIEIFIATKPSARHEISVSIIRTDNGYPAPELAAEHSVSTKFSVDPDVYVANLANSFQSTVFRFPAPVLLRTGEEYAIRIMAPTTNGFEVWCSEMGKISVNYLGQSITEQQADGSLFKSQNSSTWTADQYADLGAIINVVNYPTDMPTAVQLRTELGGASPVPGYNGISAPSTFVPNTYTQIQDEFRVLPTNAFGANGTNNTIKVYHPYHQFYSSVKGSSFVRLTTIVTDTSSDALTHAIKAVIDNYYFKVENAKPNSYELNLNNRYELVNGILTATDVTATINALGTKPSSGGVRRWGSNMWGISGGGYFDMFKLNAGTMVLPDTDLYFTAKMVTHSETTGYTLDSTYTTIPANQDIQGTGQFVSFLGGEVQRHKLNTDASFDVGAASTNSQSQYGHNFRLHCSTNNKWISPIVLLPSLTLSVARNLAKVHADTDNVSGTTDFITILSGESCVFATSDDSITVPISTNTITHFMIGGRLEITGTSSNNISCNIIGLDVENRKVYVDANLVNETGATTTLKMGMEFISESNPGGGTSQSKFISREIELAEASSSLHITVAMSTPTGTDIEVWYRTSAQELRDARWYQHTYTTVPTNDSRTFYENKLEINNLAEFTKFQVKFVPVSTNQNYASFKDLRVIALA